MGRLFSSSVLNEEPQGDDDDGHLVGQFKPIGPGSARCLHRGGNGMNDDEDKGNLEQKDWQENHLLLFEAYGTEACLMSRQIASVANRRCRGGRAFPTSGKVKPKKDGLFTKHVLSRNRMSYGIKEQRK
jgi:hypothetical protein